MCLKILLLFSLFYIQQQLSAGNMPQKDKKAKPFLNWSQSHIYFHYDCNLQHG